MKDHYSDTLKSASYLDLHVETDQSKSNDLISAMSTILSFVAKFQLFQRIEFFSRLVHFSRNLVKYTAFSRYSSANDTKTTRTRYVTHEIRSSFQQFYCHRYNPIDQFGMLFPNITKDLQLS